MFLEILILTMMELNKADRLIECFERTTNTLSQSVFEVFESISLRKREKRINKILGNIFDWEIQIDDGSVVELYRSGSEVHWRFKDGETWKKNTPNKKIMN